MTNALLLKYNIEQNSSHLKPEVTMIIRPWDYSGTVNFEGLFTDFNKKIDPEFTEFLKQLKGNFSLKEDTLFTKFSTQKSLCNKDTDIIQSLNITELATPEEVYALLVHLNSEAGRYLLTLPTEPNEEGEYEINFILGFIESKGKLKVIFIERELKNGKEEMSFHVKPLNRWGNDFPMGFIKGGYEVS
jgi:hypothetical protein